MAVHPLQGVVQHYDWGGIEYISKLLGLEIDEQPDAEYWMGIHPRGMNQITVDGDKMSLVDYFISSPRSLGDNQFALPFLFKVLDVNKMLSIQNHPSKKEAEAGFLRENKEGIPIDAPHRNFKDPNHKPEAMLALSDFYLLHGFRPWSDTRFAFETTDEFIALLDGVDSIEGLFKKIWSIPDGDVATILSELEDHLRENEYGKDEHHFWAKKALRDFGYDRGIFCIYMMNLVMIPEGKLIYQEANLLHAYLEGQNLEIMANSDNVFRAGLTKKHIDPKLLMDHLEFEPKTVEILDFDGDEIRFPVEDFMMKRIIHDGRYRSTNAEILLCLTGEGKLQCQDKEVLLHPGSLYFIDADSDYTVTWSSSGSCYVATY